MADEERGPRAAPLLRRVLYVTRNEPFRFELPSDENRYTPFFNVTVSVRNEL